MQVRLGDVLGPDLPEYLTQSPVPLAGRWGRDDAAPATLREPAVGCAENRRKTDTGMTSGLASAHPLAGELKRLGDAAFALRAIRDRVLHPGAGMVGNDIAVRRDTVQDLLISTGKASGHRRPVAQPAAERVRSYRQIPFRVLK
jgi:hypothetical protein